MRITIRAVNVSLDRDARDSVEKRFLAGLDRLSRRILRAEVRLVDQNGPRGGEDIACLVELRLRAAGRVFVEARDASVEGAVSRAVDKAATAAARTVQRRRELRRRGQSESRARPRGTRRHVDPLFS